MTVAKEHNRISSKEYRKVVGASVFGTIIFRPVFHHQDYCAAPFTAKTDSLEDSSVGRWAL